MPTAVIDNLPFEHHWGHVELKHNLGLVKTARQFTHMLRAELAAAVNLGNYPQAEELKSIILNDARCWLVAGIDANKALHTYGQALPLEECFKLKDRYQAGKPIWEPVDIWRKKSRTTNTA